ncbi:signal peptide peptidase SppA [Phascolarctobacterium sp.]|uniref:signal peptide peptidase SppA n=1 Tax=Phascolarctobacterium sp. TaxID=2049039 RepID=UPI002A805406|nr:signal peptide peptidase SppA [Phascolarctobacterium sp.]MDY5045463.1 signal peptide peptidase SppA [Phascolarctobacterium sp.]
MLKKIFISAVLLLAVLSFVISLLKGNNNSEKTVTVPDRVAVINIEGTIVCGADSKENLFQQANGVTSGTIMKQIREAAADDSVKALVLRIDSGGGSATAAEEVGRELLRFKEQTQKPIVATMGNTGASAAYWIAACASDKIYANATTLTGSIGVYMPYMNTEELFKKIGITSDKIKSGPYKDIMSNDRPMTTEEKQILQNIVDEIYDQFVYTVSAGRRMETSKVRAIADGRIYTGRQAKNIGLVDELGDYYDALAAAGTLAKIKLGKDGLPPVKERERQQPWEYFLSAEIANLIKTQVLQQLPSGLLGAAPAVQNMTR